MIRSLSHGTAMLALWLGLLVAKYVTLSITGQLYYGFFDHGVIGQFLCVALLAGVVFGLFTAIADGFGISIYNAWMEGASQEKVTSVSYEGRIREGFFSDKVEITPVVKSESEQDRLNKVFGWVIIFDMIMVFTGAIEGHFPILMMSL